MKNKLKAILFSSYIILIPANSKAGNYKIPYLFEHPRDGKFKVIPWEKDVWNKTSVEHYCGSAGLASSLNFYFDKKDSKNSILKAGAITFGLGLLKEAEDGFREGFGRKDLLADFFGIFTGILVYQGGKWFIKKL